jgi:hypothetical protein
VRAGVVLLLGGAKSRFPRWRRSLVRVKLSQGGGDLETEWLSTMPWISRIGVDATSTPSCMIARCCGLKREKARPVRAFRAGSARTPSGHNIT